MAFVGLDQKTRSRTASALRQVWRFYHQPRKNVLSRAKVGRGKYECRYCKKAGKQEDMIVDHIDPVVPLNRDIKIGEYAERMFCDESNLQVICKECSKLKTANENAIRRVIKKISDAKNDDRGCGLVKKLEILPERIKEIDNQLDYLRICKIKEEDFNLYAVSMASRIGGR